MAPHQHLFGGGVPTGVDGAWGAVTSSVDWCESNYEWFHHVAEFWNSLSSLAMVAAGCAGMALHVGVVEMRFLLAFFFVALLGCGSVGFHASLQHEAQMADELPMLWAAMTTTFILLENKDRPVPVVGRWLAPALIAHAVLTSCATFFASGTAQFVLFHVSFGSAEFFSLYQIYLIYRRHVDAAPAAPDTLAIALCWRRGIASYGVGLFCWQFDLHSCWVLAVWWPRVSGLPNPQLHAWWHVLVSSGFYLLITLAAYDRLLLLGKRPRLRWVAGVLPFVSDDAAKDT